jgi:hypothetical protein
MHKYHILTTCSRCNSQISLIIAKTEDYQRRLIPRYASCHHHGGNSIQLCWFSLMDFAQLTR